MPHPLAGPRAACTGALGMNAGDRVQTADGRRGIVDEFLHDGEALVTWDDGEFAIVKWGEIEPASQHVAIVSEMM